MVGVIVGVSDKELVQLRLGLIVGLILTVLDLLFEYPTRLN